MFTEGSRQAASDRFDEATDKRRKRIDGGNAALDVIGDRLELHAVCPQQLSRPRDGRRWLLVKGFTAGEQDVSGKGSLSKSGSESPSDRGSRYGSIASSAVGAPVEHRSTVTEAQRRHLQRGGPEAPLPHGPALV